MRNVPVSAPGSAAHASVASTRTMGRRLLSSLSRIVIVATLGLPRRAPGEGIGGVRRAQAGQAEQPEAVGETGEHLAAGEEDRVHELGAGSMREDKGVGLFHCLHSFVE